MKDPVEMHRRYRGKIETRAKVPVKGNLHVWYTPGVAEASKAIKENPDESFELTWRWNTVAIVSDGTRVLGLGDIGPEAALPVMEGKALLFKYYGGVDAIPIVHREKDPDRFIELVKALEPSFGGINLEDISSPKCFYILDRLREELNIPVWHDDQQGTAAVSLAALINAFKFVGKDIKKAKIVLFGAGAANFALFRFLKAYGVDPKNIIVIDSKGPITPEREELRGTYKWEIAESAGYAKSIEDAFKGADAVVAASKPGPGTIKKEWIKLMANDAIVFALANPVPEILPDEAKEAGAKVVATGRSDFPNQVNNSLVFPALFRGVLSVGARKITDSIVMAAVEALAKHSERYFEKGLIIAPMDDEEVFVKEAVAVGMKAIEEGLARRKISKEELEREVREILQRARQGI